MARKKKLQTQRLRELNNAEKTTTSGLNDNEKVIPAAVKAHHQAQKSKATLVNYLGSITLPSKTADLYSLQKPLKSLYFKYVISQQSEEAPLPGSLEITRTGLKVNAIVCFCTFINVTNI